MNESDIQYQQNICYKRGLEQGREEGSRETAIKTARALLRNGVSKAIVSSCTGLTVEEVNSLQLTLVSHGPGTIVQIIFTIFRAP